MRIHPEFSGGGIDEPVRANESGAPGSEEHPDESAGGSDRASDGEAPMDEGEFDPTEGEENEDEPMLDDGEAPPGDEEEPQSDGEECADAPVPIAEESGIRKPRPREWSAAHDGLILAHVRVNGSRNWKLESSRRDRRAVVRRRLKALPRSRATRRE
jgi:hypothetical protein